MIFFFFSLPLTFLSDDKVDRVHCSNVPDYTGMLAPLVGASAILRPLETSSLSFDVLLSTPAWANIDHFVWEYCRLHIDEVPRVFGLHHLLGGLDTTETIFGPKDNAESRFSTDDMYGWLASLFLAVARPAQRLVNPALGNYHIYSPTNMATWVRVREIAERSRRKAAREVLLDILRNKLRSPYGYPVRVPDALPAAGLRPARDSWQAVNVAPYLMELRALLGLRHPEPDYNTDYKTDFNTRLYAAGFNLASVPVRLQCRFPAPSDFEDAPSSLMVHLSGPSISLAVFVGANAKALMEQWPTPLLESSAQLHIFSVLDWVSSENRLSFWVSFDDWLQLQSHSQTCLLRLYRTDSREWVRNVATMSNVTIIAAPPSFITTAKIGASHFLDKTLSLRVVAGNPVG